MFNLSKTVKYNGKHVLSTVNVFKSLMNGRSRALLTFLNEHRALTVCKGCNRQTANTRMARGVC